jgi:hypothetical protein
MAFLAAQRKAHSGGLLLVTPGPSTTASAVRLLWARDPAVEVRYVAATEDASLPPEETGRVVIVIVSLAEGVRLPPSWTPRLTHQFTSFKPDGTPADALYRSCASPSCS